MTETTAFLYATVSDSNRALVVQADLLAQEVAETIRTRLGGTPDQIPPGDGVVKPRSVPAELLATMHADGSATRRATNPFGDTLATSLLLDAFDRVRKEGDGAIVWPEGYAADSVLVRLVLWPIPPRNGGGTQIPQHSQFASFQILEPIETPATPKPQNASLTYPRYKLIHRVTGSLLLQFVVDSLGFVVPATMHDIWPTGKPRPTGDLGRYYDEFLDASKTTIANWQFYPASVGKCHVRQIVQIPLIYGIPGHSN